MLSACEDTLYNINCSVEMSSLLLKLILKYTDSYFDRHYDTNQKYCECIEFQTT